MSTIDDSKPRKCGGRPVHDGWTLYQFEKVEGDKGKSVAKCLKCLNLLKNTTISRLLAHRKKCGRVPETLLSSPSSNTEITSPTTITIQSTETSHAQYNPLTSKIEIEEYVEDPHIHQNQRQHEVLWTQTQNIETFIDDAVNVNQSTMDIINEDIKRHRKSSQTHRKRNENSTIDAALSSFLIGCNLTFDIVDSKHFKNFVVALNPDYRIPSSSQLTSKVLSQLKGMDGGSSGEKTRGAKRRKYYSSDDDDSDDE